MHFSFNVDLSREEVARRVKSIDRQEERYRAGELKDRSSYSEGLARKIAQSLKVEPAAPAVEE